MLYVCMLPFFSWKEHAMNKVMKAEVDQNIILRKERLEVSVASQPTAGARIFGPIGP